MIGTGARSPLPPPVRAVLSRPPGMVESTRWMFALLAIAAVLLTLPEAVAAADGTARVVVVVSAAVLVVSWATGYLRRSAPVALDLVDVAAILAFVLATPARTSVLAFVFPALWFRTFYGSTRRAMLRCALYALSLSAALVHLPYGAVLSEAMLGSPLPGQIGAGPVLGVLPIMFLTVVVGRHLTRRLRNQERAADRDAVHAAVSARLLGEIDEDEIRRTARMAMAGICAATPGLRVLKLVRMADRVVVEHATGDFMRVPSALPPVLLTVDGPGDAADGAPGRRCAELDSAVGAACGWTFVPLPDLRNQPDGTGLLLVAPGRVPPDAVVSIRSLANQVTLALRNSQVHQELTVLATLDSLTGLANRTSFYSAVSAALQGPDRLDTTVLFVDLDDFKDVNDVFGHGAGDDVLRAIASRLRRATRPDDLCARLGGDEFAILLRDTGAAVAAEVAQRILHAVAAPARLRGGAATVGASVGVATASREARIGLEELIHRADVAMYAAKSAGKNRLQVFHQALLEADPTAASFERQLTAAVGSGELLLHYQPILELPDLRCVAVEALVRWRHPERGVLYPGSFVELAEETGAIREIGMHVLRQACADAAAWRRAQPLHPLAIHVNVSGLQLDDDWFLDGALAVLHEFGLPPEQLVLEITETVVISAPAAIERLRALAARGVVIAIDDFGTGYSALTTLRTLPVSIVKIDKSFVAGSSANAEDRTVTEAVVKMAAQMGLRTIAEGVVTDEQQAFLEAIGADAVQGFLYQHPAHAAEFGAWLERHVATVGPAPSDDGVVVQFPPRQTA